ncbi:DUF4395 domain-containing protein [Patulibacter sp. NPDC049589]|uniref:DUF4395 domain-containing protein n=1 Tax=Patulibacter sp. NPDC049589 TaxID=3154731 RepID=UPI0034248DF2
MSDATLSSPGPAAAPSFFAFPNPVNEVAARTIALGVVVLSLVALVLQLEWLVVLIALGFLARVAAGPKASPLGLLATRVIVPRLGMAPRPTAGPPKRFAQAIGATFSVASAVLLLLVDADLAGWIVLGALVGAAFLEGALGICLGCRAFAVLIRLGVVPEDVCEACNDIWSRPGVTRPGADA